MILDILGSAAISSAIGGIFGFLSKKEERASMKMQLDHQVMMVKAKTDATIEVAKMGIEQAKVAGALAVEKVEASAFESSQQPRGKFSEMLKSIIRPIILGVLMYQSYVILSSLEALTGGLQTLPEEDIVALYRIVVLSITSLTATAVGWYFAARSSKQFDKLLEKWPT